MSKRHVLYVMVAHIVLLVTVQVRVVKHVTEQANIVVPVALQVKTNIAKGLGYAHIANMANVPNVKALVEIHVLIVPVLVTVGCVVVQDTI